MNLKDITFATLPLKPNETSIGPQELWNRCSSEMGFCGARRFGHADLNELREICDQISERVWPIGNRAFAVGTNGVSFAGEIMRGIKRIGAHEWEMRLPYEATNPCRGDLVICRQHG